MNVSSSNSKLHNKHVSNFLFAFTFEQLMCRCFLDLNGCAHWTKSFLMVYSHCTGTGTGTGTWIK